LEPPNLENFLRERWLLPGRCRIRDRLAYLDATNYEKFILGIKHHFVASTDPSASSSDQHQTNQEHDMTHPLVNVSLVLSINRY